MSWHLLGPCASGAAQHSGGASRIPASWAGSVLPGLSGVDLYGRPSHPQTGNRPPVPVGRAVCPLSQHPVLPKPPAAQRTAAPGLGTSPGPPGSLGTPSFSLLFLMCLCLLGILPLCTSDSPPPNIQHGPQLRSVPLISRQPAAVRTWQRRSEREQPAPTDASLH